MSEKAGVYVHIPFCRKKCLYCDFPSRAGQDGHFEAYKDALLSEIDQSGEIKECEIDTIFFGGGTPTALPPEFLAGVLGRLARHNIAAGAEITAEANPDTVDFESLRVLKNAGFNRLSMGAQAWQGRLLERLGRAHDANGILRAYESAARAGFDNVNLDLMFSLPGQTMADWAETLQNAASLKPAHISAYSLSIEENTAFSHLLEKGEITLPGEDEDRRMYYMATDMLRDYGYRQYEISNWSLRGRECRHNIKYWKRAPYLGFGLSAHSFYNNRRWRNTHILDKYLRAFAGRMNTGNIREEISEITPREAMEETMFLGLRLNQGVSAADFGRAHGSGMFELYGAAIEKMASAGLLARSKDRVALTAKGRDVSNYVFGELLLPQ